MDFTISLYDYKVRAYELHRSVEEDPVIGEADLSPRSTHQRFIHGTFDDAALAKALEMSHWRGLPVNAEHGEAFVRALADALEQDDKLKFAHDRGVDCTTPEARDARARKILSDMGVRFR